MQIHYLIQFPLVPGDIYLLLHLVPIRQSTVLQSNKVLYQYKYSWKVSTYKSFGGERCYHLDDANTGFLWYVFAFQDLPLQIEHSCQQSSGASWRYENRLPWFSRLMWLILVRSYYLIDYGYYESVHWCSTNNVLLMYKHYMDAHHCISVPMY